MFRAKVRFGFLTTYDLTIFLKQEPDRARPGSFVLWYSNVIRHNTCSVDVGEDEHQIQEYWQQVSLRECFLYFGAEIQSRRYKADNPMAEHQWIGRAWDIRDDSDHLDESTSGTEGDGSEQPDSTESSPFHEDAVAPVADGSSSELSDPPPSPVEDYEAPRWNLRPRKRVSYAEGSSIASKRMRR
jgi:hypothetical protein